MKNLTLTVDEKLEYLLKLKLIVELVENEELNKGQNILLTLIARRGRSMKDIFHWATDNYATDILRENMDIEEGYSEEDIEEMDFTKEEIGEEIRDIYNSKLRIAEETISELNKYKDLETIDELIEVYNALRYLSIEYFELDSIEMEIAKIKYESEMQIIGSVEKWSVLIQYTGLSKDVILVTDVFKEEILVLPVSLDVSKDSVEEVNNKLQNFLEKNPYYIKTV